MVLLAMWLPLQSGPRCLTCLPMRMAVGLNFCTSGWLEVAVGQRISMGGGGGRSGVPVTRENTTHLAGVLGGVAAVWTRRAQKNVTLGVYVQVQQGVGGAII